MTWAETLEAQHEKEQIALAARHAEARRKANEKLEHEHEAARKAEEAERAKVHRDRAEEELTERLRRRFHAANANASAQDFANALPTLRAAAMTEAAAVDPVEHEVAVLLARTPAEFRGVW